MKKKIFAVFAVLLAFMLVTCDLFKQPSSAKAELPKYTPDGRPLVRLSINLGNKGFSKALTLQDAQDYVGDSWSGFDSSTEGWYEVVFIDANDTDIYRYQSPNSDGSDWEVSVPPRLYDSADKAVMLAGVKINGEYVLLAIGKITQVINKVGNSYVNASPPEDITMAAHEVTFTLYALKSQVDTSFAIVGPVLGPDGQNYSTLGVTGDDTDPTIPKFIVPAGNSLLNPGHTSANADKTDDTIGEYRVTCTDPTNFKGLVVADDSSYQTSDDYDSSGVVLDVTLISHAVGDKVRDDGNNPATFQFFIDTESASPTTGLTQMYAMVVVNGISSDPAVNKNASNNPVAPIDWVLQSGVDNTEFDELGTGSKGALFLLDLVAGPSMPGFIIPKPTPQD